MVTIYGAPYFLVLSNLTFTCSWILFFFISFLFFLFFSYGILKGASIAANRLKNTYWTTKGANHTHEHYIKVVNVVYSGSTEYTAYKYTVNSHEYQDDINYAGAVLCFPSLIVSLCIHTICTHNLYITYIFIGLLFFFYYVTHQVLNLHLI